MTDAKARRGGRRRQNGTGTIYPRQTPAGKRYDLELRGDDGRRLTRRFKTEREASEALKEALNRRDRGRETMPKRHRMRDLFDEWLEHLHQQVEHGERSYNTWRGYETYVRTHMRPALGHIYCRQLTVKDVEKYLASLPLSAQTRANHRTSLRRALNVALKWGWVDQNVVSLSDPIPVRPREVAALSLTKAQILLDALKGDRLYSVFVVALYTGLRAGELAGLRVEDLDLQAGSARIHQQIQPAKGQPLTVKPLKSFASVARLELIPEVVAVLADVIDGRTEGYVWESAPGRPYWPTSITHALTRALSRAELPRIRLHDLRHYFVSFLPQLDVHPAVAQKLARHATIGTTMNVYTSVEEGLKKQAMGRLHDALNGVTGELTGSATAKEQIPSVRRVI
jgi:integrase